MQSEVKQILEKYDIPVQGATWSLQGQTIIYHKILEQIAVKADIQFDKPDIIRAERDECVMLVVGRMREVEEVANPEDGTLSGQFVQTERVEWTIGEALLGENYKVSGKQTAYVYAMAEKRAKDRVILKLIKLHGLVYSEEESDEFKQSRPIPQQDTPMRPPSQLKKTKVEPKKLEGEELEAACRGFEREILVRTSSKGVTELMQSLYARQLLDSMPKDRAEQCREQAVARYEELRRLGK